MLYLAEVEYEIARYMSETETRKETRIVDAEDEKQAYKKVQKYFEDKTESYYAYYTVNSIVIFEVIS